MSSGAESAGAPVRYHAIDQLRAAMILVVMFGHALLPYVTVPRRFKDPATHPAFDVIALFLYSFAMPLFFITAGFAAAAMLERRGSKGLWKNRLKTILLPLLVAYAVLTPLTRAAYSFAATVSASGSIAAGIEVLQAMEWLRWSKAYHLWFLVSLLLYTALALGLKAALRSLPGSAGLTRLSRALVAGPWRTALLSILAAIALVPAYVFYDGDATTPPMQLHLFSFFLVGWLLFAHRDQLDSFRSGATGLLLLALVLVPVAAWSSRLRWFAPEQPDILIGILAGGSNGVMVACMSFGMLGLFQRRFDGQPSVVGQYISEASYWIFLIHLPLLIFVGGALSAIELPAAVKYLLTVSIVAPLVFLTYHFLVRHSLLGRQLKGRTNR